MVKSSQPCSLTTWDSWSGSVSTPALSGKLSMSESSKAGNVPAATPACLSIRKGLPGSLEIKKIDRFCDKESITNEVQVSCHSLLAFQYEVEKRDGGDDGVFHRNGLLIATKLCP